MALAQPGTQQHYVILAMFSHSLTHIHARTHTHTHTHMHTHTLALSHMGAHGKEFTVCTTMEFVSLQWAAPYEQLA
jgi:hypothetical protein